MNLRVPVLALGVLIGSPVWAQDTNPTLWSSDDVNKRIYHLTLGGEVLSDFHSGSISGLCVDPVDDSLWAAKEGSGLIVHYDRDGNELDLIATVAIHEGSGRPEGVAVDYFDDTLWTVDDESLIIFNMTKGGSLLKMYPSTTFDGLALSPQAIAADPEDGTLWITDNSTDRIYNISVSGTYLSSFPTSTFGGGISNPQGISVDDSNGTLWVTDRATHTIYHLQRDGELISTFDSEAYGSLNPTGIAYDAVEGVTNVFGLGAAAQFGMLGSSSIYFCDEDAGVAGDVGLAPGAKAKFKKGFIKGSLRVDPKAKAPKKHKVKISGGTVEEELTLASDAMVAAAENLRDIAPTQTFIKIKDSTTIFGDAGMNVIDVGRIYLKKDRTLTLNGGPDTIFVINTGHMILKDEAAIVLDGGVDARNVLFNVDDKKLVLLADEAEVNGTILAGSGWVLLVEQSVVNGAVLSAGSILLKHDAQVRFLQD